MSGCLTYKFLVQTSQRTLVGQVDSHDSQSSFLFRGNGCSTLWTSERILAWQVDSHNVAPMLSVSWDHSFLTAGQQELLASGAHSGWACTQTSSSNKPQLVPSSPPSRSYSLMPSDTHVCKLLCVHSFIHLLSLSPHPDIHSFPLSYIRALIHQLSYSESHMFS